MAVIVILFEALVVRIVTRTTISARKALLRTGWTIEASLMFAYWCCVAAAAAPKLLVVGKRYVATKAKKYQKHLHF